MGGGGRTFHDALSLLDFPLIISGHLPVVGESWAIPPGRPRWHTLGMETPRFRLGIIDFLNAAPLNYGFQHGLGAEHFSLDVEMPSACADLLRAGSVDAGLVSSIEVARIPGLAVVPGLCIASPRRVRSVVLLSRVPPEEIRTLALDRASRSSQVLVQLLLRERYGVDPAVREMPSDPVAMLGACDAALLIGDPAMRADRHGLIVLDLAEEWHGWTGLPFVFALWAVRTAAPQPPLPGGVVPFFHRSLEMGMAHLDDLVAGARREVGWTAQELREYFTENISYRLGEAERESLALYYEKAARHGFAPAGARLAFA